MAKRGGLKISAEQRQLYLIFDNLSEEVQDKDDYGSLIGDSIFDALYRFRFQSTSVEERKFEEVKKVYKRFESLLKKIKSSTPSNISLLDIQGQVEQEISHVREHRIQSMDEMYAGLSAGEFEGSVLFYSIVDTLNRGGNPVDKLRRYGLGLDSIVRERGLIHGNRNCLLRDYNDIYEAFVRARGDRRE